MNCPICGETLRSSVRDSRYMLCDKCRKKFRLPEQAAPEAEVIKEVKNVESVEAPEAPVKERKVRLDENGNPIRRKKKIKLDENGNPIRKKKIKLDENGNPVRKKKKVSVDDVKAEATRVINRDEVRAALRENAETKAKKAALKAEKAERGLSENGSITDDERDEEFHLRYANIPPKEVREKQEADMRAAYDELLSIGEQERKKKRGFFGRKKNK